MNKLPVFFMEINLVHKSRTLMEMDKINQLAANIQQYLNNHFIVSDPSVSHVEDEFNYVLRVGINNFSVECYSSSQLDKML